MAEEVHEQSSPSKNLSDAANPYWLLLSAVLPLDQRLLLKQQICRLLFQTYHNAEEMDLEPLFRRSSMLLQGPDNWQ